MSVEETALIEKYFDYELSQKELDHFDKLYQQDEFKQKVILFEAAKDYVQQSYWSTGRKLIEEKKEALTEIKNRIAQKKIYSLWKMGLAAGLFILLGAILWIAKPANSPTLHSIAQSSYTLANSTTNLDPLALNIRSSAPSNTNQLWQAYQAKAWTSIIALTANDESNTAILLLRGIAFYQQADYVLALAAFEKSSAHNSGLDDNLLWWLSSTHLQLQQPKEAKIYLQEIVQKAYPSSNQASHLLSAINALD